MFEIEIFYINLKMLIFGSFLDNFLSKKLVSGELLLRFSLATEQGICMDLSVAWLHGFNDAFSGLSFHFEIGCQPFQVVVQTI